MYMCVFEVCVHYVCCNIMKMVIVVTTGNVCLVSLKTNLLYFNYHNCKYVIRTSGIHIMLQFIKNQQVLVINCP